MRVIIHFLNGTTVDFIAPKCMLVADLKEIIDLIGDKIHRLEFP